MHGWTKFDTLWTWTKVTQGIIKYSHSKIFRTLFFCQVTWIGINMEKLKIEKTEEIENSESLSWESTSHKSEEIVESTKTNYSDFKEASSLLKQKDRTFLTFSKRICAQIGNNTNDSTSGGESTSKSIGE
jgi:hypothetical protein